MRPRILLVDDDPIFRSQFKTYLEDQFFTVTVAELGFLVLAGVLIGLMLSPGPAPVDASLSSLIPTGGLNLKNAQPKSAFKNIRGVWVMDKNVVLNAKAQDALFGFAADKGITDLYVNALSLIYEDPETLRQFIGRANQQEIRVELVARNPQGLGASNSTANLPNWTKTANHFIPLAFLRDSIAFAESSPLEQRPVGLQFDLRPYVFSENWPVLEYLTLLEVLMQEAQESDMLVSVVIPFWFDIDELQQFYNGQMLPLSHHVISIVDRVVILDFRDFAETGDGLIANVETEMAFAATLDKSVIIGVETQCNLDEPQKVTFCEEGEMVLNRELDKVITAYEKMPSWGGFAIHRFSSYADIISHTCPENSDFTVLAPSDRSRTPNRFISVRGCGGISKEPVQIYVVVTDGPRLQDKVGISGPDGHWKVDDVILGGSPLPFTHTIYAVMKPQDGPEIRSDTITVIKVPQ